MTDRPNRVGQQLGNYRLVRLLGKGGFAEVYLGEHLRLGTKAAIKVLSAQLAAQDIEQFLQEARIMAHLEHAHIVRVQDFGIEGTTPFFIMTYAPNGTIRDRYPRGQTLPLPSVVSYVEQVAGALQYAHNKKLIHRDIKPGNMLLDRYNNILLSDFGFALVAQNSRSQNSQEVVGTAAYMSPEQIQGKPRPASDQYSLGIVVYEWLCGSLPFRGSLAEICTQHVFAPPPPLWKKVPTISPALEQVVMTALAKDPKERFASVQEFAIALRQASYKRSLASFPSGALTHHPLPAPALTTSSKGISGTPIETSASSLEVASADIPSLVARPTKRFSRRTVMITLAELAVVGGGIIWLVASRSVFSSTTPRTNLVTLPLGSTLYTYRGHTNFVVAVAWSPDGKRIASSSWDTTVRVWDATDGANTFVYHGHTFFVYAVAWSPDGKRIASGSVDKTVQVWDVTDGRNIFIYQGHTDCVNGVSWSSDGEFIASSSWDTTVQVWNATNENNIFTYRGHNNVVNVVAWSPDGRRLASGSQDQTVQLWDAINDNNVLTYQGHSGSVYAVAWSPDGKRIASASDDKTVQVWNAADGSKIFTYENHSSAVNTVAWSPDGKRIASGSSDGTVQVWNAVDGGNVFTYRGHSNIVTAVAWSPDGKRIASASDDKTVQVWVAS